MHISIVIMHMHNHAHSGTDDVNSISERMGYLDTVDN